MGAIFEYTSDLLVEVTHYPTLYDIKWTVSVRNVGDESGVFSLDIYQRMQMPGGIQWSGFSLKGSVSETIAPGETKTFTGTVSRGPYTYQLMAKSVAGALLNPLEPKEFICGYCIDLYQRIESFATIEELEAHIASDHRQYAPMDPLRKFSVKGIAWPDHFYHQPWVNPDREDYGRIINWHCIAFTEMLQEGEMWNGYVLPTTGNTRIATSQPSYFNMPEGWVGAHRDAGGLIPNSTKIRLYFETDRGWTGWLDDSPYIDRIPNGSTITFEVTETRAGNWQIIESQFSEFAIADYKKV